MTITADANRTVPANRATPGTERRHAPAARPGVPETVPPNRATSVEADRATPTGMPKGLGWIIFALLASDVIVVGVAFLFSYGNVRDLAEHFNIKPDLANKISPVVDVSVIGLMIVVQYLAIAGATPRELWRFRSGLVGSGLLTLILNSGLSFATDEVVHGLIDMIPPVLAIFWTDLGPAALRLLGDIRDRHRAAAAAVERDLADRIAAAQTAREERDRVDALAALEAAAIVEAAQREAAAAAAQREHDLALERERADREATIRREALAQQERLAQLDRDRAAAAASVAQAEADRVRADAARARATADAEAARAEVARLETARVEADRAAAAAAASQRASEPARPTGTGRRASGPSHRATEPDGVRSIDAARSDRLARLAKIRDTYRGEYTSWQHLLSGAVSVRAISDTTGLRRPTITEDLKHAATLLPWATSDDPQEATG